MARSTPMRTYAPDDYAWVCSRHGPGENGAICGVTLVDGVTPWPVPGDRALELEGHGFFSVLAIPGTMFKEWTRAKGSWVPVFAAVEFVALTKRRGRAPKARA